MFDADRFWARFGLQPRLEKWRPGWPSKAVLALALSILTLICKASPMTSKKTLNAKNLEALGAQRLAEVLIEISTGDAVVKRRLRLELAGREGPGAVAREVRKRLATIARSRLVVDWRDRPALVNDLETQRRAIKEQVATRDPVTGLDLM